MALVFVLTPGREFPLGEFEILLELLILFVRPSLASRMFNTSFISYVMIKTSDMLVRRG